MRKKNALQQSGGEDGGSVVFPPVLVQMLDRLESEILADRVSEESRRWLASCGLTVEQIQNQMDPVYTPARKIHLYHCGIQLRYLRPVNGLPGYGIDNCSPILSSSSWCFM
nr:hypothetical protein [Escherichia coli]